MPPEVRLAPDLTPPSEEDVTLTRAGNRLSTYFAPISAGFGPKEGSPGFHLRWQLVSRKAVTLVCLP